MLVDLCWFKLTALIHAEVSFFQLKMQIKVKFADIRVFSKPFFFVTTLNFFDQAHDQMINIFGFAQRNIFSVHILQKKNDARKRDKSTLIDSESIFL